jgi:hypothetical protein
VGHVLRHVDERAGRGVEGLAVQVEFDGAVEDVERLELLAVHVGGGAGRARVHLVVEQSETVVGVAADGLERGLGGGADLHRLAFAGEQNARKHRHRDVSLLLSSVVMAVLGSSSQDR